MNFFSSKATVYNVYTESVYKFYKVCRRSNLDFIFVVVVEE